MLTVVVSFLALSLAKRFHQLINDEELALLDDEVKVHDANKHLLPALDDLDQYWAAVGEIKDSEGISRFPILFKLVQGLLVLPHGNADVERVFSHVSLIKNDKRNSLHHSTLNSILHVKFNSEVDCHCYAPKDILIKSVKSATKAHLSKSEKRPASATPALRPSSPKQRKLTLLASSASSSRVKRTPKPSTAHADYVTEDYVVVSDTDDV